MQITIPPVLKPLDLAEYAPGMAGQVLQVWVNPSREMQLELSGYLDEYLAAFRGDVTKRSAEAQEDVAGEIKKGGVRKGLQKMLTGGAVPTAPAAYDQTWAENRAAWMEKVLSRGNTESRVSAVELLTKRDEDPAFFEWLFARISKAIRAHRQAEKKD